MLRNLLNNFKRSYLARSAPEDVARHEDKNFVCTSNKEDVGPLRNWQNPTEMKEVIAPQNRNAPETE